MANRNAVITDSFASLDSHPKYRRFSCSITLSLSVCASLGSIEHRLVSSRDFRIELKIARAGV